MRFASSLISQLINLMSQKETTKRGLKNPNEPVIKKDLVKLISDLDKLKKSLSLTKKLKSTSSLSSEIRLNLLKLDCQILIGVIKHQAENILDYICEK